jgi:sodium-dependent dicarboxylate transporter 2/3/5
VILNIIYWATQKKWLLITLFLGTVLYLFPTPHGLTSEGYHTLIIVLSTIILIIFEPIPLPAVAMLILVFQVLFGIATPNQVASSFMSDAVFFIMGSLMLAVAIVSQGLDTRLALGIINITGHKTWRIIAGFVAVCALLSSFIGEHTVTAMMMPVGLTLVRHTSHDPKKVTGLTTLILFSIAYGSAMGSIGTPSGGGRNVIMIGYLSQFGMGNISYLEWMKYAYPILLIEIPLATMILWWTFRPEKTILDSAVRKLKVQVAKSGDITGSQVTAIGVFILVFLGWVFLSPKIGLGIVALLGVVISCDRTGRMARSEPEHQLGCYHAFRCGHLHRDSDEGYRCRALGCEQCYRKTWSDFPQYRFFKILRLGFSYRGIDKFPK